MAVRVCDKEDVRMLLALGTCQKLENLSKKWPN